jgi:hypothetical protein
MSVTVNALWSKPHYQCAHDPVEWLKTAVDANKPDFIGISQYEKTNLNDQLRDWNYGVVGSGCYGVDKKGTIQRGYGDVIGLAYDSKTWTLEENFPTKPNSVGACSLPQTDGADSEVQCAVNSHDDSNVLSCCGCVGNPQYVAPDAGGYSMGPRAFAAGLFSRKDSTGAKSPGSRKLCVVTASLPHPQTTPDGKVRSFNAEELAVLDGTVTNICGSDSDILFIGDTNLSSPQTGTGSLFSDNSLTSPLKNLMESGTPGYTCCADYPPASSPTLVANRFASDRIALACKRCSDFTVVGGSKSPGGNCAAIGQVSGLEHNYPCNASSEEHCPVRASFRWGG